MQMNPAEKQAFVNALEQTWSSVQEGRQQHKNITIWLRIHLKVQVTQINLKDKCRETYISQGKH